MESLLGFSNEIRKVFESFHQDDVKRLEDYELRLRAAIESQVAPGMKKQRTSLEEEDDSGVDATHITTSTQASTATSSSTAGSTRPSRSAKTLASGNLKLPKLGTKLRQEIKLERITETSSISTHSTKSADAKENDLNSINVKREKISIGIRSQSSNSNNSGGDSADSSILVIPNEVNIITLSDDDDGGDTDANDNNKMPPPMLPAPKKLPPKKTRNTQKNTTVAAATESSTNDTNLLEGSDAASSSQLEPKKTRKGKKTRKPVMPIVEIKKEKEVVVDADLPNGGSKKNGVNTSSDKVGSKNATMESVYEDATDKILSQPSTNGGLAVSATYVLPKNSAKETTTTSKVMVNNVGKAKASFSSIITEDDSDDDVPLQVAKNKSKELFNPCVESPMKAKVAAFEKQFQEFSSPVPPVRQTRTKTRQLAKQHSESTTTTSSTTASSMNSTSRLPKPTTPSVEIRYPSSASSVKEHNTPLGKMLIPPTKSHSSTHNSQRTQIGSSSSTSSSTTQGSLNKPSSAQTLKVRSRENSVEDAGRAKEAMVEKKRKAEERAKRAQMQREAQEREKMEKVEKLLKAKQEKEAAREAAKQLKQQQEFYKQQKLQEQKREKERKLKAELAEAAKQEREQMLSKKIADEKALLLDQMKQNRKEEPKPLYTFDMLETDDSTDDEDNAVSKKRAHRPPPPAWSLRANAKRDIIMQAGLNVNTIDMLFSCKPTTPDLAAIFPQIDTKHLQRNSSAFWNTPPRYSTLPKY